MQQPTTLVRATNAVFRALKRPVWNVTYRLTGRRIRAPMNIYDMAMYGGTFEADAAVAQNRMPSGDFRVIQHAPGRTAVEIHALEYRHINSLAPYREVSISVPVQYLRHNGNPERGYATLHMPVTSEEARWGGIVNFGFPKIVADIDIERRTGCICCELVADGVHVLTLKVDDLPVVPRTDRRKNFTLRDDAKVVESEFTLDGDIGVTTARGGARLVLGPHAIAAGLREMNLELQSRGHVFAPRCSGRLSAGHVLGEPTQPVESLAETGLTYSQV